MMGERTVMQEALFYSFRIEDHVPEDHPCAPVRDKLDALDKDTRDEHHGDSAEAVPKTGVDPDELIVIVIDALELIGARIPPSPPAPPSTPEGPVPSITPL